jgi:hypothetical protein
VINPASNRPSYPGYVPPKPSTPPAAERTRFAVETAPGPAGSPAVPAEGAVEQGIQLALAYELAATRPPVGASVPQDLLWALTGPGRTPGGAA